MYDLEQFIPQGMMLWLTDWLTDLSQQRTHSLTPTDHLPHHTTYFHIISHAVVDRSSWMREDESLTASLASWLAVQQRATTNHDMASSWLTNLEYTYVATVRDLTRTAIWLERIRLRWYDGKPLDSTPFHGHELRVPRRDHSFSVAMVVLKEDVYLGLPTS